MYYYKVITKDSKRGSMEKRTAVYGHVVESIGATELYRSKGKSIAPSEALAKIVASAENVEKSTVQKIANTPIDISWLPFAASAYNISPDIRDYVIAAPPVITADVPNRNLQGMPSEEILMWRPQFGRIAYSTFKGKPTFENHKNKDVTQAKGVNLDAIILGVPGYNLLKIVVLSAFDRTKDPELANGILNNERRFYSMGCWVEIFTCSVCGLPNGLNPCECIKRYGRGGVTPERKLVYQNFLNLGLDIFFSPV